MNDQFSLMQNLNAIADKYREADFNRQVVQRAARLLPDKVHGRRVLEMGCSWLDLSRVLCGEAREFEIVEGTKRFAQLASSELGGRAKVHQKLFEEFLPSAPYEVIVFANTIHHISDPGALLVKIRSWLTTAGLLIVTAPNTLSLHRRLGVKMGLLADPAAASERNRLFAQPGRYTMEILTRQLAEAGFAILRYDTYFLKPFSDAQMEALRLDAAVLDALFELGREMPELASTLYVEAQAR